MRFATGVPARRLTASYRRRGRPGLGLLLVTACGDEAPMPSEPLATALDDSPLEHAAKHLDIKYVCPMHPQIVRDSPGTCPICGMDLVAQSVEPEADGYPQVVLSSAVIQNMGVRTARVERGTLWKSVRTLGRVEYDETRGPHPPAGRGLGRGPESARGGGIGAQGAEAGPALRPGYPVRPR